MTHNGMLDLVLVMAEIMVTMALLVYFVNSDILDPDTLNDICHNVTNNNASVGSAESGKLICEVPSYDHTSNIIVRKIGGDK